MSASPSVASVLSNSTESRLRDRRHEDLLSVQTWERTTLYSPSRYLPDGLPIRCGGAFLCQHVNLWRSTCIIKSFHTTKQAKMPKHPKKHKYFRKRDKFPYPDPSSESEAEVPQESNGGPILPAKVKPGKNERRSKEASLPNEQKGRPDHNARNETQSLLSPALSDRDRIRPGTHIRKQVSTLTTAVQSEDQLEAEPEDQREAEPEVVKAAPIVDEVMRLLQQRMDMQMESYIDQGFGIFQRRLDVQEELLYKDRELACLRELSKSQAELLDEKTRENAEISKELRTTKIVLHTAQCTNWSLLRQGYREALVQVFNAKKQLLDESASHGASPDINVLRKRLKEWRSRYFKGQRK
ncbi:hypothetical protein M427DRAFT_58986 [Gonapodya prolifera JEL478]|uniref:Uncharacterized protein n=1 Tax=Gonapodya prolifera (strain JEL478) TaxID=1344416 RepID=A0A139A8Q9_GONPJ|nr:hypothetical protein M427DRAFT_58986 [Gonapodya prolifera JEL478]|eukprot:KXS13089.1 hypothetical protein M427DRAFT_58986 [Gonapodya prolifera JEL478]